MRNISHMFSLPVQILTYMQLKQSSETTEEEFQKPSNKRKQSN